MRFTEWVNVLGKEASLRERKMTSILAIKLWDMFDTMQDRAVRFQE